MKKPMTKRLMRKKSLITKRQCETFGCATRCAVVIMLTQQIREFRKQSPHHR
jgi:hypothetical protein